jgi:hypothetical protein
VKIPYLVAQAKSPLPSLGGSLLRPRPVLAVGITGPTRSLLLDGLLDTGSDDTVFEEWVAAAIGVDLHRAPERQVGLVGRAHLVRCRYAPVELRITAGIRETYRWTTLVGFVSTHLRYSLLGHASCLQFFDAEFRGADHEVVLTSNSSFPGQRD